MEYNMPAVLSARGEINVDCSLTHPKINLEVSKKASVNTMGYAGVVCPITKQVIAAGINQHFAVNYPSNIEVELQGEKVKVVYSPNKSVESANKNIDLWAYTVTPFATIKPMYEPVQTKEFTFGQTMGLALKHEITVNSRTMDLQGMIEQMSLYNYNPMNMALFSWTNTAVRYDGRPSCRLMESKMTYDPKSSSTQKVEIELEYG